MNGPEYAVGLLVARLAEALPAKLAELRTRLGVKANDLPDPRLVLGHEPESTAQDQLPAVFVVEQTSDVTPEQADHLGNTFVVDTPVAVFAMVGAPNYEQTAKLRQRYTLAIREILLARPALAEGARIISRGLREAHSTTDRTRDRRLVAGVRFTITIRTEETLASYIQQIGQASAVDLTVTLE